MSKTITDIIPPSRRRQMEGGMGEPYQSPHTPNTPPPQRPFREKPASRGGFPYGTAAVALILIVGSLVVLASFTNAKVIVIPSSTSASIAGDEFTSTFTSGDLPYETVTVTKTVSGTVPAESTETVNDPAQGPITIYNAQSNPQTLIKNTRFASADGHVFRIHDSVSVPAGSATAPGSVQVVAYADVGGDSYNIPATTFTVPGLSGSKAFTLVTAKSAAPMTGGFSGSRPSVSQATRDAQNQKNQAALLKSMTDDASAKPDLRTAKRYHCKGRSGECKSPRHACCCRIPRSIACKGNRVENNWQLQWATRTYRKHQRTYPQSRYGRQGASQ
jgi:hypothetical protein